jgi:ZIP family zinc transporter
MNLESNVWIAFALTLFAGLSTGIGSAIAFFTKKTNKRFLSISLGFSAGVMIYVSFVEILAKAKKSIVNYGMQNNFGELTSTILTVSAFFLGILIILFIDKLIPEQKNPHEPHLVEEMEKNIIINERKLLRMGLFTALVIAIHNFPEGLATFTSALSNPTLGISIAIAIAIHNIPEGIAVSIPLYFSTGSKAKAFWLSFSSGLAEPIGGLVGYLILKPYFNELTFGLLFASVAGIMVFISLDELLPTAREYGTGHDSIYGLIAGMLVMAISLMLFL